jgi:hypothetical protein
MWPEYEIRFLRGRTPTLVYWLCCMGDDQAVRLMRQMLSLKCERAEVWRGDSLVHAQPSMRVVRESRPANGNERSSFVVQGTESSRRS